MRATSRGQGNFRRACEWRCTRADSDPPAASARSACSRWAGVATRAERCRYVASRGSRQKSAGAITRADSRTHAGGAACEWVCQAGAATLLHVHARPGAKHAAIVGEHGGRLKIAIDAPPVEGKANEALVAY